MGKIGEKPETRPVIPCWCWYNPGSVQSESYNMINLLLIVHLLCIMIQKYFIDNIIIIHVYTYLSFISINSLCK